MNESRAGVFDAFHEPAAGAASALRRAITAATRIPEPRAVAGLLDAARLPAAIAPAAHDLALRLAHGLRMRKTSAGRAGIVQNLLQEYALSSQEGIALMCLAEALLRIPDAATRDDLIRDKIAQGRWQTHLGKSPSLFVNAATWGLLITGKLVATHSESGLSAAIGRLVGLGGEPLVRKGVDLAMRMMGEQFVTGETIDEALRNAAPREREGFRYSFDMLGEAALTARDAERYGRDYESAIHAIGRASAGRGIHDGPGISIKLSALHPRYGRAQQDRVTTELLPTLARLCALAKGYDIGLNIDAEEADRLEISLDLLERLALDPALAGWNGLGFVVQAYQKRCPPVIDWLIDLARRGERRLMVRLVKGAYWDSEIKRAQIDGQDGYPVYTRKPHTDASYIACARKLLAAPDAVYPQFATHNAQTLASIHELADPSRWTPTQYEFQCLHGMGEPLYEQVVGRREEGKLGRPCRIYAPVGTHETLLAYLVRRLLENGANTSFVNRIADPTLALETLVRDPVELIEAAAREEGDLGLPHPAIPLPRALYGALRRNSRGLDLASEAQLGELAAALASAAKDEWRAEPMLATGALADGARAEPMPATGALADGARAEPLPATGALADARRVEPMLATVARVDVEPSSAAATRIGATPSSAAAERIGATPSSAAAGPADRESAQAAPVVNPADRSDVVGSVREATLADVELALASAAAHAPAWAATAPAERARLLDGAADRLEQDMPRLMSVLIREAGKTAANAVAEVREAVDFLRYYAHEVRDGFDNATHVPLGPVVCISPWNFPLAIFTGQVAAALAAGNVVLAKPAEQTPLVAAAAVRALRAAGVPDFALQLLPGDGSVVGAALVADARVKGVLFTGSTEVARLLQRSVAGRVDANGRAIPLVAETGGQNAMIVDSSALAEQVVSDVLVSAFDSAGQRCSALRVLCVQDDAADRLLEMLLGAMAELRVGDPARLSTDVGPVIDAEAKARVDRHVAAMRAKGRRVHALAGHGSPPLDAGTFVVPTLIELDAVSQLEHEVFGPVLHLVRFRRDELDELVGQIDRTGYGLTMGLHTRIDETIARVTGLAHAGNVYVNRNMVGAVVGVQPFGGEGLSGTGPKAGGPLYLYRLLSKRPDDVLARALDPAASAHDGASPRPASASGVDAPPVPSATLRALAEWARASHPDVRAACIRFAAAARCGASLVLPGPTGERNVYSLVPRAAVLCLAASEADRLVQLAAVLASGGRAVWAADDASAGLRRRLPSEVQSRIALASDWTAPEIACDAVLLHGSIDELADVQRRLAGRDGPVVSVERLEPGDAAVPLERLVVERALSVNTAAAGGNASLMTIG